MKIAFFSESIADEAALKILVAGILGEEVENTDLPNTIERRSSSHLDRNLPAVIRGVYYWTDAEALIVVSDSDDKTVHTKEHKEQLNDQCRFCQLLLATTSTIKKLKGERNFKIAVGTPVPAIEAWYLFGRNPQLFESTWIRKQEGEKISYDRKTLKEELYNTSRPSIDLETEYAIKEATRIVLSKLLEDLEKAFPEGFGNMASEIRSWKQ